MPPLETIATWMLVGAIAGFLANLVVRGQGTGLFGNIIIGIAGAVIAGWLLPRLGVSFSVATGASAFADRIVNQSLSAFAGAVLLLFALKMLRGR